MNGCKRRGREVALALAGALAFLHGQLGVMHGDLSSRCGWSAGVNRGILVMLLLVRTVCGSGGGG
jgi:hypothetical protein